MLMLVVVGTGSVVEVDLVDVSISLGGSTPVSTVMSDLELKV